MSSITNEERTRREQLLFETHRERQLEALFPRESIIDVIDDQSALCWSETTQVVKRLRDLLPFGRILAPSGFEVFLNRDLSRIVDVAQEQLLYWHLAGTTTQTNYPAESLLLWNKDDYLWFITIPVYRNILINQVLQGERLRYLERFRVDYDEINLTFHELRLVSTPQNQLVITEGRELAYRWRNNEWETILENPDPRLIDPVIHHLPPVQPSSPSYRTEPNQIEPEELAEAIQTLEERELPPSEPPTPSESSWGSDFIPSWNRGNQVCWCEGKELCTCGFRPDTPPTPPSVVLWTPGRHYLPSSE